MDFSFTEKEEAFRSEVREFLAEHHDSEGVRADGADVESAMDKLPKLLAWNQALYEKGWVGFSCRNTFFI